ncbi:hypothetical protein PCANB_000129 [Pneumocystis canis]|nr:hypothetical protein PCANB_000129 [Pneumocystis canis]
MIEITRFLERLEHNKTNIITADIQDLLRIRANVIYALKLILRKEESLGKIMKEQKEYIENILYEIEQRQSEIKGVLTNEIEKEEEENGREIKEEEIKTEILIQHQEMADSMTQEMLKFAQNMKINAQTMGKIAERDQILVSSVGHLLGKNIDIMRNANKRLIKYRKINKGTFLLSLLSIGVVFISFFIVFFIMHLT